MKTSAMAHFRGVVVRGGGGSVEVVDDSGRECGDVIDGLPAAVDGKPNLVR